MKSFIKKIPKIFGKLNELGQLFLLLKFSGFKKTTEKLRIPVPIRICLQISVITRTILVALLIPI